MKYLVIVTAVCLVLVMVADAVRDLIPYLVAAIVIVYTVTSLFGRRGG